MLPHESSISLRFCTMCSLEALHELLTSGNTVQLFGIGKYDAKKVDLLISLSFRVSAVVKTNLKEFCGKNKY